MNGSEAARAAELEADVLDDLWRRVMPIDGRSPVFGAMIESVSLSGSFPSTVLRVELTVERRVAPLELPAIATWDLWDLEDGFEVAANDVDAAVFLTHIEEWINWIGADDWQPTSADTDEEGRVLIFE